MMKKDELKEYLLRDAENLRSLSFSETYIKDTIGLTERWGSTGLLMGLDDPYIGRQVARLFENQRLQNENDESSYRIPEGAHTHWVEPQWKRVSIPAIRRVFGVFVPYHLVSVQAMTGPEDRMYYTGLDERTNSVINQAKTRQIGRDWWDSNNTLDENGRHNLDLEANRLAAFCQRYQNEVTREVLTDLWNNCGSRAQAQYQDEDQLLSLIEGMSAYIAAKIKGRDATWIVASPEVVGLLKHLVSEWQEDGENPYHDEDGRRYYDQSVKYRGMLKDKWKLYENPVGRSSDVLMGHKESKNHYFSGYFYNPYRPFTYQPGWWTDDGRKDPGILWARYSKRLVDGNFYGAIDISNLPEPEQPPELEQENTPAEKAESEA